MRRVNDLSVALTEVGMWAEVKIDVNGNIVRGLLGRVSNGDFCFASNERRLDGFDSFRDSSCSWDSIIGGFRFKWTINVGACGTCTLQEIITRRTFDTVLELSFLGLITEDNHFIPIEGITPISCEPTDVTNEMAFYHKNYEKSTEYTWCDKCICIDDNGCEIFNNYKSVSHGYIGYDDQIKCLRPANVNELAIYKRTFIE